MRLRDVPRDIFVVWGKPATNVRRHADSILFQQGPVILDNSTEIIPIKDFFVEYVR